MTFQDSLLSSSSVFFTRSPPPRPLLPAITVDFTYGNSSVVSVAVVLRGQSASRTELVQWGGHCHRARRDLTVPSEGSCCLNQLTAA
jgi:hypothetical protein